MSALREPRTVIFALGANLGSPLAALSTAARTLGDVMDEVRTSAVYRTPPEGGADQPDYLNAVVCGRTSLTAADALDLAHRLESDAGRVRTTPGAARTLDVDVLFVGDEVTDRPGLRVPHPRWRTRPFVVVPLLDVLPGWRDPKGGRTVSEIAAEAGWGAHMFPRVLEPGALLSVETR